MISAPSIGVRVEVDAQNGVLRGNEELWLGQVGPYRERGLASREQARRRVVAHVDDHGSPQRDSHRGGADACAARGRRHSHGRRVGVDRSSDQRSQDGDADPAVDARRRSSQAARWRRAGGHPSIGYLAWCHTLQGAFGLPRHVQRAHCQRSSSFVDWVRELPSRRGGGCEGPLVTTLHFPRGRVGLHAQRAALLVAAHSRSRATS